MKKLHIIILAAAGIITFAGSFGVTSFFKKKQSELMAQNPPKQPQTSENFQDPETTELDPLLVEDAGSSLQKRMLEDQLKNLIFDVRETMKDHKLREKDIVSQEERINLARATILEDIDRLSKLNDQLKMTISELKNRQQNLKDTLVEISAVEKTNLQRIAATYDKMDVTQSSTIIINMASTQQLDDAVKIIYLMTDRVSAKLLGEISTNKPELACLLSTELKKVKESE